MNADPMSSSQPPNVAENYKILCYWMDSSCLDLTLSERRDIEGGCSEGPQFCHRYTRCHLHHAVRMWELPVWRLLRRSKASDAGRERFSALGGWAGGSGGEKGLLGSQ